MLHVYCSFSYFSRYKKMEACVTPHPETDEVTGAAWQPFSERLNAVPSRISSGSIPGLSVEKFLEDNRTLALNIFRFKPFPFMIHVPIILGIVASILWCCMIFASKFHYSL